MSRIVHSLVASGLIALAAAASALAATAPSVTTGPVTAVGPTTATVSGTVNPNGTATTWYVEYGTSTSYGSKTSSTSAGAGTTSPSVTANLGGLTAGTTYHYRLVAVSTAGTSHGSDGILQTSSTPSAATGGASSVTSTSATLNGTVNPNGRSTTWYFEYGTSTSYGTKTPAKSAGAGTSASAVSAPVTGLTTGRLYHFRLVATSDAGTNRGADQTFVPTAVPAVVTKPASSIRDTTAQLNGTVNPNGLTTTTIFEYGTSTAYGTKTAVKSAGSGTSARSVSAGLAGLAGATTYHYRLVATSAAGTTAGADQTFTTLGRATAQTGGATSVGEQTATLTGSVTPNGHSTSWYFEWGTSLSYGTRLATRSAGSGTTAVAVSAPLSGLSAGTTYHFRLVATNSAGTTTGADVVFTTAGAAVTLVATSSRVIFGLPVRLVGVIGTKQADQRVTVFAQRSGAGVVLGRHDRPDRCRGNVDAPRSSEDRHELQGALQRRRQSDCRYRRATGGHVARRAEASRSLFDARHRHALVRGPGRAAAATARERQLAHNCAARARPPLDGCLHAPPRARPLDAARGDERQPGRGRLSRRYEPLDRLPASLRFCHAPGKIRTCDLCLRRAALYPLSYGRSGRDSVAAPQFR